MKTYAESLEVSERAFDDFFRELLIAVPGVAIPLLRRVFHRATARLDARMRPLVRVDRVLMRAHCARWIQSYLKAMPEPAAGTTRLVTAQEAADAWPPSPGCVFGERIHVRFGDLNCRCATPTEYRPRDDLAPWLDRDYVPGFANSED